ncbi:alpha/beta hydrolase family protein [Brevundimonas faecalis]|uniref:Esterase n=1 Tax=Brevundimonas faecalis TaxID=947378 RepID=A0ABV2R7D8_9CAUL
MVLRLNRGSLLACVLAATPLALSACAAAAPARIESPAAPTRGALVSAVLLESPDRAALQAFADDLPGGLRVAQGADLYRLTYRTVSKGRSVEASALVAVPADPARLKGTVAYLHGTNVTRALSPSMPDRADGNQEAAVFAGAGYLTLLPDYIGLGVSTEPQAYVVVQPQVDASLDLLRAARTFAQREGWPLPSDLFLMGFSQGGQSAAGLHRELERTPLPGYVLKATAAIAGPHALADLLVEKTRPPASIEPVNIAYVAFAVTAYSVYYDRPLAQTVPADLAARLPGLFDGSHEPGEIIAALPADAADLFRPEVLAALQARPDHWLHRALAENDTDAWVPRAPLRIITGQADRDVTPASSRALYDHARARGGAVEWVSIEGADHMGTAAASYAPVLAWFDRLSATP